MYINYYLKEIIQKPFNVGSKPVSLHFTNKEA